MSGHTKSIPDGYGAVTPSLVVRDARKAMEFYRKAFGATETYRLDAPDGGVMHAEVRAWGTPIMLSEENPKMGCLAPTSLPGRPSGLYIYVDDVDAAFDRAVKAGAKVEQPVADMFWGDRFGTVSDPSGHFWSLATHKQDLSPEDIKRGAKEFFATHKM